MKLFPAIVMLLALTVFHCASAQNSKIAKDTGYIDELNLKAWKIRNQDLEKARSYALQALQEAQKINYIRGKSYSYNLLGHYSKVKGSYDTAFSYYQQSLAIRQALNDTAGIASCYRNVMSIYKLRGEHDQAIETGLKALKLLGPMKSAVKAAKERAWIQTNLSFLYLKTGRYDKAISHALESKNTFINLDDEEGIAAAAMNLGNVYEQMKEYSKALVQFQEAISLNSKLDNQRELAKAYNNSGNVYFATDRYSQALSSYKRSLIIRQVNGYDDDINGSLYNIGVIHNSFHEKDSALAYFRKSLEISTASGNLEGQFEAHRAIGNVLSSDGQHEVAVSHFLKSFSLSSRSNSLPEVLILLKDMSANYRALGKSDSALLYSEKYAALNDSLNEVLRRSIELEAEIRHKKYELDISEEKNKSQNFIILAMLAIIVALGTSLLLILRSVASRKKTARLQESLKAQELATLDAMVEGRENEQKRLAIELHDTIGSILSAIKYAFKSMEGHLSGSQHQRINSMLDEALVEVRRISHDMASSTLSEKGITEALTKLCDTIQSMGQIEIKLDIYGLSERINTTLEIQVYRITQELLTNILRHAHARNVSIQLIKNKDDINMMVIDDGKGFDPKDALLKRGIGLQNIDKRVHSLSGNWDIDSGKGSGTTVIINIPIKQHHII